MTFEKRSSFQAQNRCRFRAAPFRRLHTEHGTPTALGSPGAAPEQQAVCKQSGRASTAYSARGCLAARQSRQAGGEGGGGAARGQVGSDTMP